MDNETNMIEGLLAELGYHKLQMTPLESIMVIAAIGVVATILFYVCKLAVMQAGGHPADPQHHQPHQIHVGRPPLQQPRDDQHLPHHPADDILLAAPVCLQAEDSHL